MATLDLRGSSGTLRLSHNVGGATVRSFVIVGPASTTPGPPGPAGPALPADQMAALSATYAPKASATIAYAAIGSTSGSVIGETRRIVGGGDDDGMPLVWWVPAGASAPAWCYAIAPTTRYGA